MTQWYTRVGNIGFNLILLNILWTLGCLSGLIVLGIFPATVAMVAVIKHMVMEDDNPSIVRLFLENFNEQFFMANLLGYFMVAIGLIIFIDIRWIQEMNEGLLQQVMMGLTFIVVLIYLLSLMYLFPIYLHFRFTFIQYPFQAFIMAIGKPVQTLFLIVAMIIMIMVYMIFPVLMVVFGLSLIFYLLTRVTATSFPRKDTYNSETF